MPRIPVRQALRAPTIVSEIRALLEPSTYVRLLHEAAVTGQLPIYNVNGSPTGNFMALTSDQRIDVMKYLINKVAPDPPREVHNVVVTAQAIANDPSAILSAATQDLLRLVNETEEEYEPTRPAS